MYLLLFKRNICCCSKELFVAVQKKYLLLFNRNICCCLKKYCLLFKKYICCCLNERLGPNSFKASAVRDLQGSGYGPTIKSKRQPLTTNYKEEAMRGQYQFFDSRFESMTQFWGWAALTWGWLPCWHSFFRTSLLYSMLATTIAICSPLLISASCHVVVVRRLDKQYWEVFQAQSCKARWGFKAICWSRIRAGFKSRIRAGWSVDLQYVLRSFNMCCTQKIMPSPGWMDLY